MKEKLISLLYTDINCQITNKNEILSLVQNYKTWFQKHDLYKLYLALFPADSLGPEKNRQILLDHLFGESYCLICGKKLTNRGFRRKRLTCSKKCKNKLWSKKQTENNTCHRMTEETKKESRTKQSETLLKKIENGSFTPKSTNYFTHSDIIVDGMNFRSSWEVLYWLYNKDSGIEYEQLRIPYIDNAGKKHFYIIDFVDRENKKIVEVKPKKYQMEERFLPKKEALEKWCKKNKYQYFYADEKIIGNLFQREQYENKINSCIATHETKKILNKRLYNGLKAYIKN